MAKFFRGLFMAGHSKWANIKHRKAAADAKKGKVTTRLVKEITIAAKMGGGDPTANPRLRLAMEKARENNVPKENVERAIKRGTGELEGVDYVELRFEGYGIGGAGIIVDCLTDNNTRTVAEVRHAFNKYGGNMGTDGCVSFQFNHCGQLVFAPGTNEDALMEAALEAGAQDVITNDDGSLEVITVPADFVEVKTQLEAKGFTAELAEVTMKPTVESELSGEDAQKMQRLLDALEGLDDVQDVFTNAVLID
jgi:YebC/PmpR family DNA-binding regulatory protein